MEKKSKLVKIIRIPKISDDCILCFAQNPQQIPFVIKRFYFITKANPLLSRGHHTHRKNIQVLFCLQGSVKMILDDGFEKNEMVLSKPENGILLEPMVWHEMHNIKRNTILLVVCSEIYDSGDYIRDYQDFLKLIGKDETDKI